MNKILILLLLILAIVVIVGFVLYFKFNYIFINKNDKEVLNSGFSFLDDEYLDNYIKNLNNGNV